MSTEKEWMDQHLAAVTPLPFGERTAPRRRWAWARVRVRGRGVAVRRALMATGAIAGICGATLAVWPAGISVSIDVSSYRVDDSRLVETAPGLYRGDAVLVIRSGDDGFVEAGASFVVGGRHGTGVCRMNRRAGVERCTFHVDGEADRHAVDVFREDGWRRGYVGGPEVTIAAKGPIPVPFPVGVGSDQP